MLTENNESQVNIAKLYINHQSLSIDTGIHTLPDDKIFALTKLKACADDKIIVIQKLKSVLGRVENIMGKGENAS